MGVCYGSDEFQRGRMEHIPERCEHCEAMLLEGCEILVADALKGRKGEKLREGRASARPICGAIVRRCDGGWKAAAP